LKKAVDLSDGVYDVIAEFVASLVPTQPMLTSLSSIIFLDDFKFFEYMDAHYVDKVKSIISNFLKGTYERCMYGNLPKSIQQDYSGFVHRQFKMNLDTNIPSDLENKLRGYKFIGIYHGLNDCKFLDDHAKYLKCFYQPINDFSFIDLENSCAIEFRYKDLEFFPTARIALRRGETYDRTYEMTTHWNIYNDSVSKISRLKHSASFPLMELVIRFIY
jgi:hypothetical protein